MLFHPVPLKISRHHIVPTLPTLDLSLLLLPIGRYLFHHLYPVRRLQLGPLHVAWAEDHAECLPKIGLQTQPTEQAEQGTKCTVELLRV